MSEGYILRVPGENFERGCQEVGFLKIEIQPQYIGVPITSKNSKLYQIVYTSPLCQNCDLETLALNF